MKVVRISVIGALLGMPVLAQMTYPGCAALDVSQFKSTELLNKKGDNGAAPDASLAEPTQFDVHGVMKAGVLDHVDIYFVERGGGTGAGISANKGDGHVKVFDGVTKKVTVMGTIKVKGDQDSGLMGIVLDPNYDTNHWMYLWYVPPPASSSANRHLKLGRFTVKSDNTLDMTSEKVLLDLLGSKTDNWHSGGPMQFDSYGDLWINIGNNSDDVNETNFSQFSKDSLSNDEWGAGNTMSMRGGMIRIHPDNSVKGYSIPSGNFGEYWAAQFDKQGRSALAAQYRDPNKVLPEVYVKGERSNYSLWVHPTKRWAAWGTVNYESTRDEFNITNHPIFSGFPYFMADNEATPGEQQMLGAVENPATPINKSLLKTGVDTLPPAIQGSINRLVPVAIGGPVYVYDRNNPSKTKFPPHLHNSWIGFDFKGSHMWIFGLDTNSLAVTTKTQVDLTLFKGTSFRSPLGGHYGPDGNLYFLNYDGFYTVINPGFTKVEYTGTCQLAPDQTSIAEKPKAEIGVAFTAARMVVEEPGDHEFGLYDLAGNRLVTHKGTQGSEYVFAQFRSELKLDKGVYIVRVKTARGAFVRNISFF